MGGKKLVIIVMAGLGVVSFALSFLLSSMLGAPQPSSAEEAPGQDGAQQDLGPLSPARAASVVPRAKQLDELVKEVRLRIGEYQRKQANLEKREKRLTLAEELLKKQAKELEALRMELVAPLNGLREARDELERSRVLIAKEEEANLRRIAAVYEKMDAAKAAERLSQMCNNQQEADAVKILYNMSERSAGKVLQEMTDVSLVARLTGMMKKVQQQQK